MKKIIIVLLSLVVVQSLHAAVYYVNGNTNWTALSPTPTSSDVIVVQNNSTLTINSSSAVCYDIWVGYNSGGSKGNGTLVFNSSTDQLTVSRALVYGDGAKTGTINMSSGGKLIVGYFSIGNVGAWTAGTGTVESTGSYHDWISDASFCSFYNLTISKNAGYACWIDNQAVTVSNTLTISGAGSFVNYDGTIPTYYNLTSKDVVINSGAELWFGGSARVSISGNLTNNGTFNFGGGNNTFCRFNGASAQSIGGSTSTVYEKLEIYNTSSTGVTLNTASSVDTQLDLNDGYFYTSSSSVLTVLDNATANAGSSASFVEGPLKKTGNDAFTFPVGDEGKWARLTITAPSNATTEYTAEYLFRGYGTYTPINSPLNNISTVEYWDLSQAVNNDDVKITLYWENATESGITNCPDLTVGHWNGSAWVEEAGTASGTCSGAGTGSVITNAVVGTYSPFTFASKSTSVNPLPVTLLSFDAVCGKNNDLDFSWTTQTELNADLFEIEQSPDGIDYQVVASKEAVGNSAQIQQYKTSLNRDWTGEMYFRLSQRDKNGATVKFNPIATNCKSPAKPAFGVHNGQGFILLPNMADITLMDLTGRILGQWKVEHDGSWPIENWMNLEKGVYMMFIQHGGNTETLKFLK